MERQMRVQGSGFPVQGYPILILIVVLLFATVVSAQDKGKIEGTIYLANDQTVLMNANVIKYLTHRLQIIESIGGKTTYLIPIEKQFKKRLRTRMIEGHLVQYAYTGTVTPVVSLQKPKTKYIEFDFKKKSIKEVSKNDDNDDPFKPSDTKLKEKVKEKDDKDKTKPQRS